MKGGFRSQELDGYEMTLGFRQVRAAQGRNTLHPVLCVLYELDDDELMICSYGSPHGPFIGQVPWVTSKGEYILRLLHGIRSVEIPRYPEFISVP